MASTLEKARAYLRASQSSKEERRLVRKIDFFILTFCCLSYFTNYLDRSNLTNAYVSGMREDLAFKGNQLTQINTIFTCGYIIGQIPSNLALHYIAPRLFFPSMMLAWGGLTMLTAAAQQPQHIMAIRFFQGIAESSTFVGTHYILGSWFTERELGKRSGIFTASGLAGTMFGGFIQSGIQASLHRKAGLNGWRWLFIIDGLITLPIAIYGLLLFPDTPSKTRAPYLSATERRLAAARVPDPHSATSPFTWRFVRRAATSFAFWGFVVLWAIAGEVESFNSNGLLALYLQSHPTKHYTVAQLNDYPTGVAAVGIVSTLLWAALTDLLGGRSRALVGYWCAGVCAVAAAMVLGAFKSTGAVMAAYYLSGSAYAAQAVMFAWANDVLRGENEAFRALVVAAMNTASNVVNAWWSIVFYSADMAPRFTRGMYAMIGTAIALAIWTALLSVWAIRHERVRGRGGDADALASGDSLDGRAGGAGQGDEDGDNGLSQQVEIEENEGRERVLAEKV
ncbi:uncharacterized protein K452DRAFT_317051 [Aplosporella prunicola CBS 121167]|uniref:Major facilitator superfamily (MFS) profile domain-containing protein n=1 Tax=Aplosporella prunicola CBS 121167 TaxID=1176127 RepID=A0A6A6BL26_9PEZI|nr:uncharacterized protein K452DRAFT_317051 [Aplosporella prunicola CBS 121167]KAF2143567.1 hypothetical protein K452DRAFT_317051 [Aplosporella prunicola CBS 121167]